MIPTILLLAAIASPELTPIPATVERVKDGDTIVVVAHLGFDVHITLSIRLDGVNCPERRGLQAKAGAEAKQFTETWVATYPEVSIVDTGKRSFARWVSIVCPPGGGQCLTESLIASGLCKVRS